MILHSVTTDTPFRFADHKAKEFSKQGRTVLVVVPSRWCVSYFGKYEHISHKNIYSDADGNGPIFVRSAECEYSLRAVAVSRLILVGEIPRRPAGIVAQRLHGSCDPEIWESQDLGVCSEDFAKLCKLHNLKHWEVLEKLANRRSIPWFDRKSWLESNDPVLKYFRS